MANKRILVVVDMQYDFINGTLGSKYAEETVLPNVKKKFSENFDHILFTQDTHYHDYLVNTLEGKMLPVEHCIEGTHGWEIHKDLLSCKYDAIIKKNTFGSVSPLPEYIRDLLSPEEKTRGTATIEVAGLCTDICVVSNALILRSAFPNVPIIVDSSCCGGTTKKAHDAALLTMKSCQIEVK